MFLGKWYYKYSSFWLSNSRFVLKTTKTPVFVFIAEILWRTFWSNNWRFIFWHLKILSYSHLSRNSNKLSTYIGQTDKCHHNNMVKSHSDSYSRKNLIDLNYWKISVHWCFQILYTVHNFCTLKSENLFFRGLWLMLEGGLMKFLAKGATEKIVEDADEKRERLSIMNHIFCSSHIFVFWFLVFWLV